MRINRNNYEAYLLDLSEGNLSDELHNELKSFLAQNPDIDAELIDDVSTLDIQTYDSIDKNLLKFDSINTSNRKHFFIAYHEGDLTTSEESEVLAFISKNTNLKQEFDEYSKLYLKSSTVIFEDKKALHSIASKNNIRGISYWAVRIAALLIIGLIINSLYNTSNIEPKYTLSKNNSNLTPTLENGSKIDFSEFFQIKDKAGIPSEKSSTNKRENLAKKYEAKKAATFDPVDNQKTTNNFVKKEKKEVIYNNPSLNNGIANLNQKNNNEEKNIKEPLPTKPIQTPPTILAYLGEKAKEKKILTENGRPNIVSLLNKGSNSISGQDLLATSETEESNSTTIKLFGLKIERITKK